VAAAGGRLYLAKDSRQSAETFWATYANLTRWKIAKNKLDSICVMESDCGIRAGERST
jgi:decaprenylphospho-beta-D-ribofuranose 2-oxidase